MASWGLPAVGENRFSSDHPSRSALVGLLAAALGIRREEAQNQAALGRSVRLAVRQLTPGRLIRDFHTVQVPKRDKKARYATRKDELEGPSDRLNTIISRRDYRCDGLWVVGVTITEQSQWSLEDLKSALRAPRFTLYLGRKSCPLAAPLAPVVVQTDGLKEALCTDFPLFDEGQRRWLAVEGVSDYFWEIEAVDMEPQETRYPEDDVLSRDRWQFRQRAEYHARIKEV